MNFCFKLMLISSLCFIFSISILPPANAEDAEKPVELETGFYYTVKKGDTLWDISQHFSDSPWLWPDLWKENDQIANPHWIYPGERIRLYLKKDQFAQKATPAPTVEVTEEPAPPPPKGTFFFYNAIDQVGFIRKPPVSTSGTIFKSKDDKELISSGDMLYVRPPVKGQSAMIPGSRYTVYRYLAPTDEKSSEKEIGTQHLLLGVVEVLRNESDFSIVQVVESYRRMKIGDLLMPYALRSPEIYLKESVDPFDGMVISAEDHLKLIGEQTIIFIDKGANDNVFPGQQYHIYYQEEERIDPKARDRVLLPPVDIGKLIVLHTEETTSTVLVTYTDQEIKPGLKVRAPVR
ncbi:MAG: LysM peptidoglycan-binding domain-containing protein [Desulfobacteraceae bacterium]|nr:LysM peptidoglycan-binding domain-containing protein [Desulfobacteraceae bacterium]